MIPEQDNPSSLSCLRDQITYLFLTLSEAFFRAVITEILFQSSSLFGKERGCRPIFAY